MLDISHEQAFQRAYQMKKHLNRLSEIKKKSKTIDNHLSGTFFSIPKRQGFKGIWWSEKINRENKILLEKLIKIKQQKHPSLKPLQESKCIKHKNMLIDNETIFSRIAHVCPSLSTKNILKEYKKFKDYSELRTKIMNKRILSFKKLEKNKASHLSQSELRSPDLL